MVNRWKLFRGEIFGSLGGDRGIIANAPKGGFSLFFDKIDKFANFYKKFIIIFVIVSFYKNVSKVPTRSHELTVLTDLINKFYKKFL